MLVPRVEMFWGDIDGQTLTCNSGRLPSEETPIDGMRFDLNIKQKELLSIDQRIITYKQKWFLIQSARISYQNNVHEMSNVRRVLLNLEERSQKCENHPNVPNTQYPNKKVLRIFVIF